MKFFKVMKKIRKFCKFESVETMQLQASAAHLPTFSFPFQKQAGEMLYAGRKLTALEACSSGLVSHVFWPTSLMQEVTPRVQKIATGSAKVDA